MILKYPAEGLWRVMWQSQPRCCWGCHIRELIVLWKPHSETLEGIDLEGRDNMSKSCSDSRFSEAVMRFDMLLCAFLGCKIWHYMKYVHDMYVYIYIFIHHPSFSRLKKSMLDRSKWSGRVNPLAFLQALRKCVMSGTTNCMCFNIQGNPLHKHGGSNYSSVIVKRLVSRNWRIQNFWSHACCISANHTPNHTRE